MFKIYINGTNLSYIQYVNTIWLPSVSPIIANGNTKAPAGGILILRSASYIGQLKYIPDVSRSLNAL